MALLPGLESVSSIHPLFVHFPIALWPVALVGLLYGSLRDQEWAWKSGLFLHYAATVMAAITVFTGYRAADLLGHESAGHALVHVHRNLMVGAFSLACVVAFLSLYSTYKASRRLRVPVLLGLGLVNGVAIFGADRGAEMVYVYGTGVSFDAPPVTEGHHSGGGHAH